MWEATSIVERLLALKCALIVIKLQLNDEQWVMMMMAVHMNIQKKKRSRFCHRTSKLDNRFDVMIPLRQMVLQKETDSKSISYFGRIDIFEIFCSSRILDVRYWKCNATGQNSRHCIDSLPFCCPSEWRLLFVRCYRSHSKFPLSQLIIMNRSIEYLD